MQRTSAASLSASEILGLLDKDELADLAKQVESQGGGTTEALLALSPARLLFEMVKLRLPFVRMMNDVATMLGQIEANLKGNIRFIVLPGLASEVELDFGPQLRGAVATALNQGFLAEHSQCIAKRLSDLDRLVHSICQNVKSTRVSHMDQIGEMLERRAQVSDPASAFRDRWLAEQHTRHRREYNPTEIYRLKGLSNRLAELEALIKKVLVASPGISALIAGLPEGVVRVSAVLWQNARLGPISQGYPIARRSVEDGQFNSVERAADDLREAILAASEYADAVDGIYDFLNLQIWRQRWRVYELWVLARIVRVMISEGALIEDHSRVVGGTWQLKFTKDSTPVLRFGLNGQTIELYYQLYQGRGSTGDMPDLAIRFKDGRFIAVVDPKHGYSYSRQDLNDVCERYANAFQPFFSCICNYFPVRETEEVRHDPLSLVLYDFSPGVSAAVAKFESELRNSLLLAFRELGLELHLRPGLIVLFDVSSSAAGVRRVLADAFRSEVARMDVEPRPDSRALVFSTQVDREGNLEELKSETLLEGWFHGGTDYRIALRLAVARLVNMIPPTELWLLTDGVGAGDMQDLAPELTKTGCRLVIFEVANSAFRSLAESVGGRHIQL